MIIVVWMHRNREIGSIAHITPQMSLLDAIINTDIISCREIRWALS